jgi:hypothetical protein
MDEEFKKRRSKANKKYYETHKEVIVEYRKKKRNPEVEAARFKRWYEANKERLLKLKREKYRRGEK